MADEQIGECPILILGNKIDKPNAASEDEIRHYFGLHGRTTGRVSVLLSLLTTCRLSPYNHCVLIIMVEGFKLLIVYVHVKVVVAF